MRKYAIIAAGGSGKRMGNTVPKQFLPINGKPILWYSVKAFTQAFNDITVVVVAPASHLEQAKESCSEFRDAVFIEGGSSRFQSVKNGLSMVKEDSIVFVHDAVRCLVTKDLLSRCYDQAMEKGSAIPAIPVNDSLRIIADGGNKTMPRDSIRIIQTPQTFKSGIILPAFRGEEQPHFTDEATVVEASGITVHLIEGEETNIKITRPFDLQIAGNILERRSLL